MTDDEAIKKFEEYCEECRKNAKRVGCREEDILCDKCKVSNAIRALEEVTKRKDQKMECKCVNFKGQKVKEVHHDTVELDDGLVITTEEFVHRYNSLMDYFDILMKEARDNACGGHCNCTTDNIR